MTAALCDLGALERDPYNASRNRAVRGGKLDVQRVTKKVETYLQQKPGRDEGGHIKENLTDLRKAIESPVSCSTDTR